MAWFTILAQSGDVIGPGGVAGWTSAGMLGAVLGWLLGKHLPSLLVTIELKDKQIKELVEGKDRQLKEFIDSRDALFRELWFRQSEQWKTILTDSQKAELDQRVDYQNSLQRIQEHCQRESEAVGKAIMSELRTAIAEFRKHGRENKP